LSHLKPKEVSIIAKRDTFLLGINGEKDFPNFFRKFPDIAFDIIKSIIDITNIRLLKANKQITSSFEINKIINSIDSIDMRTIF